MKLDQFIDALLATSDADLSSFFASHSEIMRKPELAASLWARAELLRVSNSSGAQWLEQLAEALQHAELIDFDSLPPYQLYEAVSREEYSADGAVEAWQHHLQDKSWPAEWLLHLNAKIQQLAQTPAPSPRLVDWAKIQIAVARYIDDANLLAQMLTTAGGVVVLVNQDIESGLAYQIEAIETSLVTSEITRGGVVYAAAQNFSRQFSGLKTHSPQVLNSFGGKFIHALANVLPLLHSSDTGTLVFTQGAKVLCQLVQMPSPEIPENLITLLLNSFSYQEASDELIYLFTSIAGTLREREGSRELIVVLLEHAYQMAQDLGKPESLALAAFNLAYRLLDIHMARHDLSVQADCKRSASMFEIASDFFALTHRDYEHGQALLGQAEAIYEQKQDSLHAQRARELCERAITLFGAHAQDEQAIRAYQLLGQSARNLGDTNASRVAFENVVILADQLQDRNASSSASYQVALCILLDPTTDIQAKNPLLVEILEEALSFASQDEIRVDCLDLLVNRRCMLQSIDESKESANMWRLIDIVSQIEAMLRSGNLTPNAQARLMCMRGGIHFRLGRSRVIRFDPKEYQKSAANSMVRGAELFEQLGETGPALRTWVALALELPHAQFDQVEVLREHVDSAIMQFECVKELDDFARSIIVHTKAQVAKHNGKLEDALELFQQAVALSDAQPWAGASAKLYLANRAATLIEMERWPDAYRDLKRALEMETELRGRTPRLSADSQLSAFETTVAIESNFFQRPFAQMAVVCARLNRVEEAFGYSERSRGSVLKRELQAMGQHEAPSVELISRSSEVFQYLDGGDQTAFIQYLVSDKGTLAFLLTSKCTEVFALPAKSDRLIESLRYGYIDDGAKTELAGLFDAYATEPTSEDLLVRCCQGLDEIGQRMFDVLLAPVWSALQRLAVRRLIISAHLGLERLPWGIIRIPNDHLYLAKQFVVTKIPSAAVLCHAARQPRAGVTSTVLIIGAHPDLTVLEIEQKLIQNALQHQREITVDAKTCADRQAFLNATQGRNHIHVGCHGFFDAANPLQTRLILDSAQGCYVTLGELLHADGFHPLSGFSVVLSACDVGLVVQDKGGEHLGLATAFLLAQARQVVAALWPVQDLSTALLMERFYTNWARNTHDAPLALQQSQLWISSQTGEQLAILMQHTSETVKLDLSQRLRFMQQQKRFRTQRYPFSHPYWWGGFELFGTR